MREFLADLLRQRRVIIWPDNQAAKQSLVKGQSPSQTIHRMIRRFGRCDLSHPAYIWIDRVPSSSNPSDPLSRDKGALVLGLVGACEVEESLSSWMSDHSTP